MTDLQNTPSAEALAEAGGPSGLGRGPAVACDEYYQLSRRGFMALGSAAAAAAAFAPAWLPQISLARSYNAAAQDVIVQIYLRGACDGLSIVVPYNEPAYQSARPLLKVNGPGVSGNNVLDLGTGSTAVSSTAPGNTVVFGLHAALAALMPAWNNSHMLLVQAAGLTNTNKSHFDAQRFMEVGKINDPLLSSGWLGRHLATVGPMQASAAVRAVSIADGLARTLAGSPLAVPVPDLGNNTGALPGLTNFVNYGLKGTSSTRIARQSSIAAMYNATTGPIRPAAQTTLSTIALLNAIGASGYAPAGSAVYPTTTLGNSLKSTAALINANVGVEAVAIDYGGWDTHANQGGTSGIILGTSMYSTMATLGNAIGAFYNDVIAARARNVTVVIMSEFGRRVGENGTIGTDHGYGNVMMVLGRAVNGRRVMTNWPGMPTTAVPTNQDLGVTIDYRDILQEIVRVRLGNPDIASIFPGYTPVNRGVLL